MKQDTRGRVRTPTKRREALLDEFERGGVSAAKFAELVGVKYSTFAAWVCARRKKRAVAPKTRGTALALPAPPSLRLVEAVVAAEAKTVSEEVSVGVAPGLAIHLSGGIRIEIGNAAQLKLAVSLLNALGVERRC